MESSEILEKDYQTVYKPLIKFLYSHPEIPFSFACSGNQIEYYKKRKNEVSMEKINISPQTNNVLRTD